MGNKWLNHDEFDDDNDDDDDDYGDDDVGDMRAPTHGGVREEIARLKYRIPVKGVPQPWRAASRMLLAILMIVVICMI